MLVSSFHPCDFLGFCGPSCHVCFSLNRFRKLLLPSPLLPSSSQVLSGCAIIVRGQPRGGPPPERQINLSNIRAFAMARRAAQSQPDTKDTHDEVSGSMLLFVSGCLVKFGQASAVHPLARLIILFSATGWCVC